MRCLKFLLSDFKRYALGLLQLTRQLTVTAIDVVRDLRWLFAFLLLTLFVGVKFFLDRDDILLENIIDLTNTELRMLFGLDDDGKTNLRRSEIKSFARGLYFWGDFLTGTLLVALGIFLLGLLMRRRVWQVSALAIILAATSAGVTANLLRLTTGRPRPVFTSIPDGFYGLRFEGRYHSFPSGHSATALATATVVTTASPVIGLVVSGGAALVVWSRLYLRAHRPADVWAGSMLGVIFGLAFGLAARRAFRTD